VKYKTPLLIVYAVVKKQAGSLDQAAGTPHGTGRRSVRSPPRCSG